MSNVSSNIFESIVDDISEIGKNRHQKTLIEHAQLNRADCQKSIKDLPALSELKQRSVIVMSAGPSVHRRHSIIKTVKAGFNGAVVATDGTYIACLKAGLIPDFVVTLDPHPTRVVRWFGDHDFVKHTQTDDYFARQDLDIEFRKNSIEQNKQHIDLVNQYGHLSKAIVSSSVARNVVERIKEAKFDMYWWNPLVDDPRVPHSITRQLHIINKFPCMNTGGTVGTAAWVFAHSILKSQILALVGMDFGYYADTPKEKTQTYYELISHLGSEKELDQCFVEYEFPLTGEKFYTDPTYFWYRQNFIELLKKSTKKTINCTEGGTLFGNHVECMHLDSFLKNYH